MSPARADQPRSGAWLSRLLLAPPILILAMVGLRFILHPVEAVGRDINLVLPSAQAVTHMRVSGVFPLFTALGLLYCWLSEKRLALGLGLSAVLMGLALAVRVAGMAVDATPLAGELKLIIAELVFMALSLLGLWREGRRLRP
jgi:hypothetical protein